MSSGYDGGYSYPCKRDSDGVPVKIEHGLCDKQIQTDDDIFETSWEKIKEEYLEESACSICLESFVSVGEHQVATLKCGHVFGDSCIRRWLTEAKSEGGPKCPTCKSKAKVVDIKGVVPRCIQKPDPSLIIEYKQKILETRTERLKVEQELEIINEQIRSTREDTEKISKILEADKAELAQLKAIENERMSSLIVKAAHKSQLQRAIFQPLVNHRRLDLEHGSESRVCGVSDMYGVIMIAQKKGSMNQVSYGLTNISTTEWRPTEYIPLHQQQIKDIAFHPFDAQVLTASVDKTVKLTDIFSSTVVMTLPIEEVVWSCCWNDKDPNYFYTGLRNGTVHEFDKRNGRLPSGTIHVPPGPGRTPCTAVNFVYGESFSGVVATRLKNSTFSYPSLSGFITQTLPATGNFLSSHYERKTAKLLYSARPSKDTPNVTHSLWSVSLNPNPGLREEALVECSLDKCFYGGIHADQVMKSRLFAHPNREGHCLIFAGDQDIGGLIVWDTFTGKPVQKLGGIGSAFDIAQVNRCNTTNSSFVVLTEKHLYYYNWRLN